MSMSIEVVTTHRGEAAVRVVVFGTKAETLERLAPHLTSAVVQPLCYFTVRSWSLNKDALIQRVAAQDWSSQPLIARSSTLYEDDPATQQAGRFETIGGVNLVQLADAVDQVIGSYAAEISGVELEDQQVLVQPMVPDPTMSGVVFTCDPNSGMPYMVVNYDESGDPAAVTSGSSSGLATFYHFKNAPTAPADPRLRRVVELAAELETLLGHDHLDIEFAFGANDVLYLLQVRRLIAPPVREMFEEHRSALDAAAAKVELMGNRHPHVLGGPVVLGVMPDWNPAEIIGVRPRPLAFSLYRALVTDQIWAQQRHRYGYRDVRGVPLLVDLHGLPYVDVRASFNSLVPADLSDALAERLVDDYLARLVAHPALHDKVEFEIVYSCYSFTLEERLERNSGTVFGRRERAEIVDSLRLLTNRLIQPGHPAIEEDEASIAVLPQRFERVQQAGLDLPARIYWLLEDCRRHGTLAFAGFARLGFIAVEMLRSLAQIGILHRDDVARLMSSLDTVTNRMERERGRISRTEFLARYGHLRPGTYDIRSLRYDEAADLYFDWSGTESAEPVAGPDPFEMSADQRRRLDELLRRHGLDCDADALLAFIVRSIERRENSKFEFSRNLSQAMSLIHQLGASAGLSREACSYLTVDCVEGIFHGTADPDALLRRAVADGRARYAVSRRLVLPAQIVRPEEVFSFHLARTEPNYITQKSTVGAVTHVGDINAPGDLDGKILLLPSGDPGYDWIFAQPIAGFITQHGGANSHMAIRAHQFGIPAVIGAGPALFGRWTNARLLAIDCLNQRVDVLQ